MALVLTFTHAACSDASRPGGAQDAATPDAYPQPDATTVDPDSGADAQIFQCGEERCPALPPPPLWFPVFAHHCCTPNGVCGVENVDYFGDDCFERDQPGNPDDACPSVTFTLVPGSHSIVETYEGCCRPDSLCGLQTADHLGAGCVERNRLGLALHSGAAGYNTDIELTQMECTGSARR